MISNDDKKAVRGNPAAIINLVELHKHVQGHPEDTNIGFLRNKASARQLAEYAYNMHQFARQELIDHSEKWGIDVKYIHKYMDNSWTRGDAIDRYEDCIDKISGDYNDTGYNMRRAFVDYTKNLMDAIQKYRSHAKDIPEYLPMAKHYEDSRRVAQRELDDVFSRSYWDVKCTWPHSSEKPDSPCLLPRDPKLKYDSNEVFVSPAWYSQVAEREISVVNDPKLRRVFVLQARKRDVKRLEGQNISAYKCTVISHLVGTAAMHERWLAVQEGADKPVVGIGKTLPDAEALLKRRTRTAVLEELLDEM